MAQDKLKVGMFLSAYHRTDKTVMSGAIQSTIDFADALREKGHTVYVFTTGLGHFVDQGIDRDFVFRCSGIPIKQGFGPAWPTFFGSSTFDKRGQMILEELDIIHCQQPPAPFNQLPMYAQQLAKRRNIPFIFTNHTQYKEYLKSYFPFFNAFGATYRKFAEDLVIGKIRKFVAGCDLVLTPGATVANTLKNDYLYPVPIYVCPNGIDYELFKNGDGKSILARYNLMGKDVLICTGRLEKEKNLGALLDMMAIVVHQRPNAILMFVGGGSQLISLQNRAKSLGLMDKVIFTGRVDHNEMANYCAAGTIFVTGSVTETQALTCLEAMAAGCVPVTYRAPGLLDSIEDGKTGILTDQTPEALAAAVIALLADPKKLKKLSETGVKSVAKLSRPKATEKLLEYYYQAIEARKRV